MFFSGTFLYFFYYCFHCFFQACIDLQNRMDCQNDDKARELEELRERMMKENMFLNAINHKTMSVYFDAFR